MRQQRHALAPFDLGGDVVQGGDGAALAAGLDPRDSSLKLGIFGAEPWTQAMRLEMFAAAENLEFEKAALYRDQIYPIKVAELLILERRMPRSLAACMDQVTNAMSHLQGQHDRAARRLAPARAGPRCASRSYSRPLHPHRHQHVEGARIGRVPHDGGRDRIGEHELS